MTDGPDILIVGIGGTTRPASSSETALGLALDSAEAAGCRIRRFGAGELQLPLYDPTAETRSAEARELIDGVLAADGLILSSPGYHGTVSGLMKNALDYIEDIADADPPYLSDLPVGCIGVSYGWQAAVNTLQTLRGIVHALRGFPTPYGAAVNARTAALTDGGGVDTDVRAGLQLVGTQVADYAHRLKLTSP